jgi:putative ABC transport system ATP-binding protein
MSENSIINNNHLIVSVKNMSKSYFRSGIELKVFENLNFEAHEGEFLALMGSSGSGKTTLLNIIGGIDNPTTGEVIVAGDDLAKMKKSSLASWRAINIGFIFQFYNLIPVLTAAQNVELPLLLTPLNKRERKEHAKYALDLVGLTDWADHYPRQLSGGQEQRVAIARAVVSDPKILLADEPTGDLDRKSTNDILELLLKLKNDFNKTIIMVTHDPYVGKAAGRIVNIDKT